MGLLDRILGKDKPPGEAGALSPKEKWLDRYQVWIAIAGLTLGLLAAGSFSLSLLANPNVWRLRVEANSGMDFRLWVIVVMGLMYIVLPIVLALLGYVLAFPVAYLATLGRQKTGS